MTIDAHRWLKILLIVVSWCLMLLPGAPGEAQSTKSSGIPQAAETENTFVRSPDNVASPDRDHLLDLLFPDLAKRKADPRRSSAIRT